MSNIGDAERRTQDRVARLFVDALGYEHLAETIENNVRKLILDESPVNPKYYERMSKLLDALMVQRRDAALGYKEYLEKLVELTRQVHAGPAGEGGGAYPAAVDSTAKRALYDNLGCDETLALRVDAAVRERLQDEWRTSAMKTKRVRQAIAAVDTLAARRRRGR